MSGSPKFSDVEIAKWKQKILEAERQRRAEAEQRRREQAQEEERVRQLQESRYRLNSQVQGLLSDLHWQRANLYLQDAEALQYRCGNQQNLIAQTESQTQFSAIAEELARIQQAFQAALYRKRRDEAEKRRQAAISQQQFELIELQQRVQQIPDTEAIQFDAAGRQQVISVLKTLENAIALGNPTTISRPLAEATALVQKHLHQVAQGQKDSQQLQTQANQQLAQLQITLAGLKADPVVMRWQAGVVQDLETQINQAKVAIANGQTQQVISLLSNSQQQTQAIVEAANTAQLQAEQRDYIADSIAETLQEMGFNITFHQSEHPDHPASATILGATTQTGKGISVSVPIAGQVYYDVDGYVKQSAATVDGSGTAAVCDEAEQMLTEMHAGLEEKFGVKMGEVLWEGKDPNRILRQADRLPTNQRSLRRQR
ncbi:MAG: hypothetical protein AAFO04_28750 [Cyanobacteria bacterium J06592_8]